MKCSSRFQGCWLAFVFLAFTAAAEGQSTDLPPAPLALPEAGLSLLRVLGALTLVAGLFLGGAWCFRQWRSLPWQTGRTSKLNILEARPLGHRQALYLVGYEQQRLLVGSSPGGVRLLAHWPERVQPAQLTPLPPFAEESGRTASLPP